MTTVITTLVLASLVAVAACYIHATFLHRLRGFPGPKLWRVTQLPWHIHNMGGKLAHRLQHLHQKYGPVVRIGPNELSFVATSVETWRTIYSRRPQEMPKFLGGTGLHPPYNGVAGIEASTQGAHARIRKAMSPAFSERALIDQEEFITSYIEKLLSILRRSDPKPAKHDFARLFNWMAFDIIGDLALGESFEGLEQQRYHSWVATIYAGIKAIAFLQFVLFYNLEGFLHIITPQRLAEERDRFYQLAFDKTDARLARNENRRDFLSYMESSTMSTQEIHTTFSTLLVAGSESSATHLGGTIFLCLTHPAVYARLRNEIRSAFPRKEDITFQAARNLEFMGCVMQESFRVYPPSPATIPRVVPMPGEQIGDSWVSGGTVVGINQWSTYHSGLNFRDPETFDPERWLSPAVRPTKYDEDHRDVLQPFSYGSRDCIGRSLAYAEIRLTLCHLLFEFDIELCKDETGDWTDQLQFLTWEKKPLMLQVKSRALHSV